MGVAQQIGCCEGRREGADRIGTIALDQPSTTIKAVVPFPFSCGFVRFSYALLYRFAILIPSEFDCQNALVVRGIQPREQVTRRCSCDRFALKQSPALLRGVWA